MVQGETILLQPAVNEYTTLTYDWPKSEWNESSGNPLLTNNPAYQTSSFGLMEIGII